jgi:hypothetical protein
VPDPIELHPRIPAILTGLTKLRQFACGRTRLADPEPPTVPQEDIDAALILADEIEAEIMALEFSSDEFGVIGVPLQDLRSKGRGGLVAEIHYGAALDGAKAQRRLLQQRAGKQPTGDVPPVSLRDMVRFQNPIITAKELFQILDAEMPWAQSSYAGITTGFDQFTADLGDFTISMLPVIGPIYDVSTGVIGYRLPDGQKLTNMERTMRVGFAGVGVALGLVAKGVRVTSTTLKVIKLGRALALTEHENRSFVALAMAVARLKPQQAAEIAAMINAVIKGGSLTTEQAMKISRLFQIMNEYGVAAHWTRLGEKPANISGKIGSFLVFNKVTLKEGEREAIETLCKGLNNPNALVLPAIKPQDFAKGIMRQVEHVRYPDLAIGSILADIYTPRTANGRKIIQEIASKSTQAATVVINLDKTSLTSAQLLAELPRLWGKPEGWGITRVIILDSKGFFKSVPRPLRWEFVDLIGGSLSAVSREVLSKEWEALEAADKETAP